jgi:alanine racemase
MVQDIKTIKALGNLKKKITIHLKINTGMNRQGVGIDDLKRVINEIKKFKNLELEGMMSHLADADNSNNRYTLMQLDRFIEAIKIIEEEGIKLKCKHLSATAGVGKIQNPLINAVRLGIGLYGINPLNKKDKDYKKYTKLQPVLSFKSKLTKVEKIEKEEKVSYNGTYKTSKVTRIGIIPVGYYEGLDRRLSNVGLVKIQNKYCPIIGRVCMNLAVVDLGRIKAKAFEEVEIISKNSKDLNSISNMAAISHTIPYELLVKLNNSIRRAIR